ncbi:MAG: cytochrome c [Flavipsychrobacter sp.]|jgi:nitrite reductase (NO-forming)|nr:cytochrome c [Flavipsychrobacter sp.]
MKKIAVASVLTVSLFTLSAFVQNPKEASIKRGKEVYENNCMSCHQETGEGIEGSFPPLAKSDYFQKDPKKIITVILKGLNEEIKVNGKTYSMMMPEQSYLSDEEIADVTNYVANSWGNKSKVVFTPAQVKAARK